MTNNKLAQALQINKPTEMTTSDTSVTERLATKFGTTKERLYNVVRSTCKMEKATTEQFEAFLMVAEKYDLNPIMKQMWAYPERSGGIATMVGLDGWITIVNNNPQFDGYETTVQFDDKNMPFSATCTMWRKDRTRPTVKTIYMNEWRKPASTVWQSMPIHFIEMRAYIQCARMCFNISGILDGDAPTIDLSNKHPTAVNVGNSKLSQLLLPDDEPVDITHFSEETEDMVVPAEIIAQAEAMAQE